MIQKVIIMNLIYLIQNIITFYEIYEIKINKSEIDCIILKYAKIVNLREFKKILKREKLSEQY